MGPKVEKSTTNDSQILFALCQYNFFYLSQNVWSVKSPKFIQVKGSDTISMPCDIFGLW